MTEAAGGSYRLAELARHVGGSIEGDPGRTLRGVATLGEATADELSFLTNPRYRDAARESRAGAILTAPGSGVAGHDLLLVDEPYLALGRILRLYHPAPSVEPGVSPDARVAPDVDLGEGVRIESFAVVGARSRIGDGVVIGAGCVIGADCAIGAASVLRPRVVLEPGTRIGERCLIHPGVVIGADGYGFATSGGRHHKLPQVGCVVIEDDVEVGANTTIDRAMLGETRIGRGTKLDDQVMIAHGVQVGEHGLIAAQSGIAGSTRVGARVTIAGQSGLAGHLNVGDGLILAAKSALFEDRPEGGFVAGSPAIDHRRWKRSQAALKRMPEALRELRSLRSAVDALAARGDEAE